MKLRLPLVIGLLSVASIVYFNFNAFTKSWRTYRAYPEFAEAYAALSRNDETTAKLAFEKGLKLDPGNHAAQANFLTLTTRQTQTLTFEILYETPIFVGIKAPRAPLIYRRPKINLTPNIRLSLYSVEARTTRRVISTPKRSSLDKIVYDLNDMGFRALDEGREDMALAAFQESLTQNPKQSLILRQVAYMKLKRGDEQGALTAFDNALQLGGIDPATQYNLEREASALDRRFTATAYSVWRSKALDRFQLAATGPSLGQSQSALETAFRPQLGANIDPHKLTGFARILWGYVGDSLHIKEESLQAGLGIRARPILNENLVLSAERLIALGAASRNDWLLRASWSTGSGFSPPFGKANWPFWSLYLDAALIRPQDPDLFISGETRLGHSFGFGNDNRFILTPFAGFSTSAQDAGTTTVLSEASLGLWLRCRFNNAPRRDFRSSLDFRVEYRAKVSGDSSSSSGPLITLALSY